MKKVAFLFLALVRLAWGYTDYIDHWVPDYKSRIELDVKMIGTPKPGQKIFYSVVDTDTKKSIVKNQLIEPGKIASFDTGIRINDIFLYRYANCDTYKDKYTFKREANLTITLSGIGYKEKINSSTNLIVKVNEKICGRRNMHDYSVGVSSALGLVSHQKVINELGITTNIASSGDSTEYKPGWQHLNYRISLKLPYSFSQYVSQDIKWATATSFEKSGIFVPEH